MFIRYCVILYSCNKYYNAPKDTYTAEIYYTYQTGIAAPRAAHARSATSTSPSPPSVSCPPT